MAATRTERVVSIKRAIKDVVIQGLRDVFDGAYAEPAFEDMRVVNEYPKDAQQYPCIVVRFKGRKYPNAGVGHYEIFPDPKGVYRRWEHRRFEGELEFECCSLSALERDKLSDALLELLSFGSLTAALNGLLVRAYGDVNDPFNPMSLLFQINLNTDDLEEQGDSADLAPWQAEDALIYTSTFSMETTGGFYNSLPTDDEGLRYIASAAMQPYLLSEDLPFSTEGDPAQWVYSFSYFDDGEVTGQAVISSITHGADYFDHGHIYGKARISSTDVKADVHHDAATVIGSGHPSSSDHAAFVDAGSVIGAGVPSGSEVFVHGNSYVDAGTVIGAGVPSGADSLTTLPFIVQAVDTPNDGSGHATISATWDQPTVNQNHLFMLVGVRHTLAFSTYGVSLPAGWTLVFSPRVNNSTGATFFLARKLNAASESGTVTVTITKDNGTAVAEGNPRCSMQMIEVDASAISNPTPSVLASGSGTSGGVRGYDAANRTGGGTAFVNSGVDVADCFVIGGACVPTNGNLFMWDSEAASRPDGWGIILQSPGVSGDNSNNPDLVSIGQRDANASTSDARVYEHFASVGYDTNGMFPAWGWIRIG